MERLGNERDWCARCEFPKNRQKILLFFFKRWLLSLKWEQEGSSVLISMVVGNYLAWKITSVETFS